MLLIKNLHVLSGWRIQRILVAVCLLLLFSHSQSSVFSQTTQNQGVNNQTTAKVLSNVRKAVNYNKLRKLKRGFVLEEVDAKSNGNQANIKVLTFGSSGEFREDSIPLASRPFGFAGRFGWQLDGAGFPTPVPQRLREKLLIPAWVRGGWWLEENAPFVFAVLPEETNKS